MFRQYLSHESDTMAANAFVSDYHSALFIGLLSLDLTFASYSVSRIVFSAWLLTVIIMCMLHLS